MAESFDVEDNDQAVVAMLEYPVCGLKPLQHGFWPLSNVCLVCGAPTVG